MNGDDRTAPTATPRPVALLRSGDDDADRAAAAWAASWGPTWSPRVVELRTPRTVVVMEPALVVAGVPVAGAADQVAAAVECALVLGVPAACVPWWFPPQPDGPRDVTVALVAGTDAAPVIRLATRIARSRGLPLTVVEVDGSPADHPVAAARLAAAEHLAALLVIGLPDPRRTGPGSWAAWHTVAPTLLVPTRRAVAPRTPPPASDARDPAWPAGSTRSS